MREALTGTGSTPVPWYFGMAFCSIHGYYTPGTSPGCPACQWMFRTARFFPTVPLDPSPFQYLPSGGG